MNRTVFEMLRHYVNRKLWVDNLDLVLMTYRITSKFYSSLKFFSQSRNSRITVKGWLGVNFGFSSVQKAQPTFDSDWIVKNVSNNLGLVLKMNVKRLTFDEMKGKRFSRFCFLFFSFAIYVNRDPIKEFWIPLLVPLAYSLFKYSSVTMRFTSNVK